MSGKTARKARRTSPLMSVAVHCLVVPLFGATGDDGKPVDLLPRRRLTTAILPIVCCATRATSGGYDLGGGVVGERFSEGHGQTIHGKNKSAMPKIILAIRRQCRHITRMTTRYLIQYELDGQWITCATRKTFDAAKAKAKAERKAMNGARETSVIREGDPEILRRKTCEQFQLV
jgi:hypothetical protein